MDIINLTEEDDEADEEHQELPDVLLGSGVYQIVGIRYYTGVVHPGEFVTLVREPNNPYDRNAIRVDNIHAEKVGHIKATMAKHLAVVMDNQRVIRIQGTIPREGNEYTLPLVLDFYSIMSTDDQARISAQNLCNALRGDHNFHPRPEFSASALSNPSSTSTVSVVTKKLDWCAQQTALDELFDIALKKQYENLPNITMPSCLQNICLMEHQIKGIKWLVKRETNASPPPFYRIVQEKGNAMYLCEITQSSQSQPPKSIRGSILADEMGLGKSIQTLGLILLAPPAGVKYEQKSVGSPDIAVQQNPCSKNRCTLIVCPVSVMGNWTEQVSQFIAPGVLSVEIYHGANRHSVLTEVKQGKVDILLVSYNTLAAECDASGQGAERQTKKSKRESIFEVDFHRIVLDEAHVTRNSKTRSFKAVSKIKADRKLAITGTPFVNSSDDLFSLVSFLGVEPLDEKSIFTRAITQPIKQGDEIGLTRLRTTMGFLSLRRSKQNVDFKLVEKVVQLCQVEFMNDAHKRVYDALFGTVRVAMEAILGGDASKALKNYSVIFEKLLRLRQACCSGLLLTQERRDAAIKLWDEMNSQKTGNKLTAEEGLALLAKLKGAFAEVADSIPECGICLMEMEESDGIVLAKCGHAFCKLCIQRVLNKKCPYCRATFEQSEIINMIQAAQASNPKSDEIAVDDLKFGVPPKMQALLSAIQGMQADEKGVIFSQFTSHLDIIGATMKEAGHTFVRIDGSVCAASRISAISQFNSDASNSPRFILCSLLASGTGINLTRANWCFMMDVWWNDAVESQAMDRIHRISQTRKVKVLRFVMVGTIEERIIKVQERKSLQAKSVVQKLQGDERKKALLGDLRGLLDINEA